MNSRRVFLLAIFSALGISATSVTAFAQKGQGKGQLAVVADKDAAWFAKAKAAYPTDVCIVSDEKLAGDMGEAVNFIDRVPGQPDRLIRFCCKGCVKDFNKDPEKYLKILNVAGAAAVGEKAVNSSAPTK